MYDAELADDRNQADAKIENCCLVHIIDECGIWPYDRHLMSTYGSYIYLDFHLLLSETQCVDKLFSLIIVCAM